MIFVLLAILLFVIVIMIFVRQPKFGSMPGKELAARISNSSNYKKNAFQNLSPTPNLTEGVSFFKVFKEFFFERKDRIKPSATLPSIKTDLLNLDPAKDVMVWFGHSSYFLQIDCKKILVDPVLSGAASPIAFTTRAFAGTDIYTTDDIPSIDYLFISHDHWDHLDYSTIIKLKPRIGKVICGLGVSAHFIRWGFDKNNIIELDWHEQVHLDEGFELNTIPARHFSGRGFSRNKSLWLSYALRTPTKNIFIGGDSGYDTHFAEAGKKFGPFDLAILENGQYDKNWKYIHMIPAEALQAAKDLRARALIPVHSSKFALGNHSWDDPLQTISSLHGNDKSLQLITPLIGEEVVLNDTTRAYSSWWTGIK